MTGPWIGLIAVAATVAGVAAAWRGLRGRRRRSLDVHPGGPVRERDLPGLLGIDPGTGSTATHPAPEAGSQDPGDGASPTTPHAAILAVQVDGLPEVCARYGEVAGQRALREVILTVRNTLRNADTFQRARSGRVVAVLPGMNADVAGQVALRVQRAVASLTLITHSGDEVQLGVTVGRAVAPGDGESVRELHHAAERDLEERSGQLPQDEPGTGERLRRALPPSPN